MITSNTTRRRISVSLWQVLTCFCTNPYPCGHQGFRSDAQIPGPSARPGWVRSPRSVAAPGARYSAPSAPPICGSMAVRAIHGSPLGPHASPELHQQTTDVPLADLKPDFSPPLHKTFTQNRTFSFCSDTLPVSLDQAGSRLYDWRAEVGISSTWYAKRRFGENGRLIEHSQGARQKSSSRRHSYC
jgi:hypothetical protein